MEDQRVLIDTSIVIEHLRKRNKQKSILYKIFPQYEIVLSSISVFELYAGATDKRKISDIEHILSVIEVVPFTSAIAQKAAHIYQLLKKTNSLLDIRDLFIGATALTLNLPLVTLDKGHFKRIAELEIIDEHNL
ncbi:MAG: type II toxin-antitoxin system VapC family toxin [Nitrospirae bacterium]|nr:type II toxin-antitoxin system VapC family toxin [Nitrospirota bacterium]